jgi:putative transposase
LSIWRLSITMAVDFCIGAVEEALAKYSRPEIFNADQGSHFTSAAFTGLLPQNKIAITPVVLLLRPVVLLLRLDGRGSWWDSVFVEWLLRPTKYEEVYLRA